MLQFRVNYREIFFIQIKNETDWFIIENKWNFFFQRVCWVLFGRKIYTIFPDRYTLATIFFFQIEQIRPFES